MTEDPLRPWAAHVPNFLPYVSTEYEARMLAITGMQIGDGEHIYPLTIVNDRYGGCYSGARFTAWPLDFHQVPMDIDEGDPTCQHFWETYKGIVGKGETIQDAYNDLHSKLCEIYEGNE